MKGIFRLTIFKDVAIASGSGVGGGSLGYANTLYRAPIRFYEDPQWAGLNDWQVALAPHYRDAERMLGVVPYDEDDPADDYLREYAEEIGVGGDLREDTRRRLPRRGRQDRQRSLLRRRGSRPHRLPQVRPLHGRLPARRQEHAGQELPLVRGTRRRDRHARAHGHGHQAARPRRLRRHERALGRVAAQAEDHADREGCRRRRGSARHEPPAAGVQAQWLAPAARRPARRARAHELRGDPRRHAPRGRRPT